VNLAGKMPPKEKKTPDREERKKRKQSSKGKEEATLIRDEPEPNLFLESLQSIYPTPNGDRPSSKKKVSTTLTINLLTFSPLTINASSKSQRKRSVPAQSTINKTINERFNHPETCSAT
jgi:hypothetical protein